MSNLLIIDDEPEICFTFKKMLEKEGYCVKTAANLLEVRNHLNSAPFDTIISDIILPDTNGLELLKMVKENSPDIPVIMITGEPNLTTAVESVRYGAYDYLTKPISRHQLLQVVGKSIEKKWLLDEKKRLEQENQEYQKTLEKKVGDRTKALEELNAFINNIIESIPSIMVTLNMDDHITMLNSNALAFLQGYRKQGYRKEDLLSRSYDQVFPLVVSQHIKQVIEDNGWNISHECELNEITLGYNISLLMNNNQEIMGKVIIMRDISEKKKLERELIQSEKLATLGLLAGKISHEMGNPLFGILGYAEMLESKYPEEQDLKFIISQTLRLKEMTRDLLAISKPKPPQIRAVNINKLLEETISFLKEVTGQIKYHRVITHFSPQLSLIQGDEEQLKQALMNLIINASQAMVDSGGKNILTITTTLDQEGENVLVSIEDTGCGIAPEHIDKIFDPFFTTKGEKGTGLGMSVVKEIIIKHHGRISVESRLGEGTKVLVFLPVQAGQGQAKN